MQRNDLENVSITRNYIMFQCRLHRQSNVLRSGIIQYVSICAKKYRSLKKIGGLLLALMITTQLPNNFTTKNGPFRQTNV